MRGTLSITVALLGISFIAAIGSQIVVNCTASNIEVPKSSAE